MALLDGRQEILFFDAKSFRLKAHARSDVCTFLPLHTPCIAYSLNIDFTRSLLEDSLSVLTNYLSQ